MERKQAFFPHVILGPIAVISLLIRYCRRLNRQLFKTMNAGGDLMAIYLHWFDISKILICPFFLLYENMSDPTWSPLVQGHEYILIPINVARKTRYQNTYFHSEGCAVIVKRKSRGVMKLPLVRVWLTNRYGLNMWC